MGQEARTCFAHPPSGFQAKRRELSDGEKSCLPEVLEHFQKLSDLPTVAGSLERSPLVETERFWLSKECMCRFIRAANCNAQAAIARLEKTLVWRRTHKSALVFYDDAPNVP